MIPTPPWRLSADSLLRRSTPMYRRSAGACTLVHSPDTGCSAVARARRSASTDNTSAEISRSREARPTGRAGGLESERANIHSNTLRRPLAVTALDTRPARRPGWQLVGRDRELAELVAGLEDALDGQGR